MAVPAKVECAAHKKLILTRRMTAARILDPTPVDLVRRAHRPPLGVAHSRELNIFVIQPDPTLTQNHTTASTRSGPVGRPDELLQPPADQQR